MGVTSLQNCARLRDNDDQVTLNLSLEGDSELGLYLWPFTPTPTQARLQLASQAVTRMGGAACIAAQADAEMALATRCTQRGISYTVLRLGALVDSAGNVPLAFSASDVQLLERVAEESAKEPPLISRNDAARLGVEVTCDGLPRLTNTAIDAAWAAKWGMNSAGTDEAARSAARQDLVAAASAVQC